MLLIIMTNNEADPASFRSVLSGPHNLHPIKVKGAVSGNQGPQGVGRIAALWRNAADGSEEEVPSQWCINILILHGVQLQVLCSVEIRFS
jgi:hypothetical protein